MGQRKPRSYSRAVRSRDASYRKALRGMSFDTTARDWVAPTTEKQFHRLPADGFFCMRC